VTDVDGQSSIGSLPPERFGPSALLTPANLVTLARLALVPLLVAQIFANRVSWGTFTLAFILAASDGVDGYIARRQGSTRSGAFLDPLADKALVLGAMFALVATDAMWWVPVGIIAVRELVISVYRSWWGRRGLAVPARGLGKVKTVVQELAIGAVIAPATADSIGLGQALLWVAVALTVASGAQYLLSGRAAATAMDR
jgi:CDP-diacylglycerol--glycerol-3-phosphate 3-phosphatidyltransferase